ncbi:MAG: SAM-dependent methyltransferase [Proteobacteria bacterium]|nr:SAM-dependent methyltransferase [Pseudomonadota bacterium]
MKHSIFNFTPEELDLTNKLQLIIKQEIDTSNGSIPFSRYMELALYHPQLGYYNNLLYKFGKLGDFITSPMISSLFAKCLSKQVLELFESDVFPSRNILEIGSGNGQLMLDFLHYVGDIIEHYYILEVSCTSVALQKLRLKEELPQYINKVTWLNALPTNFNGVIIANEVLDAQVCELFAIKDRQTYLRHVSYDETGFIYVEKLPNTAYENEIVRNINTLPKLNDGYTSEINLVNRGFIQTIAGCLDKGAVIFIDYGYGMDEYYNQTHAHGTLRGFFRQHQLDDVLCFPGLIDITSSVDFSAIAQSAVDNALDLIDYTTQANFLINCGLVDDLKNVDNDKEYLKTTNQINKLISPNEMGEVFKVIGFSKNLEFYDWLGFRHGSLSHAL